jgi:predicted ATPase
VVGRKHEIGLLLDLWQQVKAGEGKVALISGEPGIGKSKLNKLEALLSSGCRIRHCRPRYRGRSSLRQTGCLCLSRS